MPVSDNIPMDISSGDEIIAAKVINGVKYLRVLVVDNTGADCPCGGGGGGAVTQGTIHWIVAPHASANPWPTRERQGNKTFSAPAPTAVAASVLASNAARVSATIYNNGSVTVYLGKDGTVTAANGIPLIPGATLNDTSSLDAWFGITAAGTGDLRIVEVA